MKTAAAAVLLILCAPAARAFSPQLPTDNDALLSGRPEKFFMYTDRDFEGVQSRPWRGGTYGFTRSPERIGGKVVETKFHEGADIAPVRRDAAGEPLDEVRAVESGRVVHVSRDGEDSNYGRYAVIRHEVEGAPVYSVYAHMASIDAVPGQSMSIGGRIGRMGYTGAGINQRRAHLHLEFALFWHDGFESWHDAHFPTPNKHGVYNGINLAGLDAAGFYLQQRKNPALSLPRYIRQQAPFFALRIPESPHFQLPRRYPWLVKGDATGTRSWVVEFTAAGLPVGLEPSAETAAAPRIEWAKPSGVPYTKATRGLVEGSGRNPRLGENGEKLVSLLVWDPAHPTARP